MSETEYTIILTAAEVADRSLNNYGMLALLKQARTDLHLTKEDAA